MDKKSLCFEAQVDKSPQHYLKLANAKLMELKGEVDSQLKNLLDEVDHTESTGNIAPADASILETLKQMAKNFIDSSAGSLPHKEYPYNN